MHFEPTKQRRIRQSDPSKRQLDLVIQHYFNQPKQWWHIVVITHQEFNKKRDDSDEFVIPFEGEGRRGWITHPTCARYELDVRDADFFAKFRKLINRAAEDRDVEPDPDLIAPWAEWLSSREYLQEWLQLDVEHLDASTCNLHSMIEKSADLQPKIERKSWESWVERNEVSREAQLTRSRAAAERFSESARRLDSAATAADRREGWLSERRGVLRER